MLKQETVPEAIDVRWLRSCDCQMHKTTILYTFLCMDQHCWKCLSIHVRFQDTKKLTKIFEMFVCMSRWAIKEGKREREREGVCVCLNVCGRGERKSVCRCMCESLRECVCVGVWVCTNEREREREWERGGRWIERWLCMYYIMHSLLCTLQ